MRTVAQRTVAQRTVLQRALRVGVAMGVVLVGVSGCLIDERKYDPALRDPNGDSSAALTDPATCDAYCAVVQSNCTGMYQVYQNTDDCLKICSLLPSGKGLADPSNTNTVACRERNAEFATSEKDAYCPAAGPGGAGRCGSNCDAYCILRQALCADISGQNVNLATCQKQCPALRDDVAYRPNPGTTGDNMQCRINHLINASQSPADALRHCWHTSVAPDVQMATPSPCADPPTTPGNCERYCELVMFSCTDAFQVYDSVGQCRAVCKAFPLGTSADLGEKPEENTVGCRRYHSYAALNDPNFHCPHAGPMGDGHCGDEVRDNCQSYCRILKRACTTRFDAEYVPGGVLGALVDNPDADDLGSCEQTCQDTLAELGAAPDSHYSIAAAQQISSDDDRMPGGDRGDVLQCRAYHAILALGGLSGSDPTPSECDAAFGASPCQ